MRGGGFCGRALTAMLVFVVGQSVYAAEGESTLQIKDAVGNKKFTEDTRITDIELKAQAGSLSRYSLKFDLSYSGPPVGNLNDPEVPNPDNRPRNNRTSLGGSLGLRYRLSSNDALNLGAGLRWLSPYHQMAGDKVNKKPGEKDYEISDPRVSYDRTYPVGETQMRSSVKGSVTTADYYQDRGQIGSVGMSQGVKYTIPQSRWIVGLVGDLDFYFFDRDYVPSDGSMSTYYLSFIPSLEYKLTDNLNLRTSVAYSYASLRRDPAWWNMPMPSGRFGVGWAITRHIYFNPYLNFYSEKPSWRTTSLSFSTVFSIF